MKWPFDLSGGEVKHAVAVCEEGKEDTKMSGSTCENSAVFPSLPLAIKWVRESVKQNRSVRYQVMLIWKIYLVLNFTTCMCVYYTE